MPKKSLPIVRREKVLKILRDAREMAKFHWVRKGATSLTDNHLDILKQAYIDNADEGERTHALYAYPPPNFGMAMGYLCRTIYRENDPGTNYLRIKMLVKYGQGCSCRHHRSFAEAVRLVMNDLKEIRAQEREKAKAKRNKTD